MHEKKGWLKSKTEKKEQGFFWGGRLLAHLVKTQQRGPRNLGKDRGEQMRSHWAGSQ